MSDRQDQLEAKIHELEAALLTGSRRMRRLMATNVVLAVVVLAFGGAGAAYAVAAANSVNSASIIDGSIITPDLKNGALSGSKILDNAVTGADVNERSLNLAGNCSNGAIKGNVLVRGLSSGEPGGISNGDFTTNGTAFSYNCAGGQVLVWRHAVGSYFVKFMNNDHLGAVVSPDQPGMTASVIHSGSDGNISFEITVRTDTGTPADAEVSLLLW